MLHRWLSAVILLPDRYTYQVPADLGLVARDVTFANAQAQPLHGLWFMPVRQAGEALGATVEAPVVLFCPGTSGNLSSHLHYVELLCRAGCQVLGFDYTGFGQSAGQASLHTLLSDVLCACDFLRQARQLTSFGIFGISLGANLALHVATERADIRAVAVEGLAVYSEITRGVLEHGIMGPRSITSMTYHPRAPGLRQHHVVNTWRVSGWLARLLTRIGTVFFRFAGQDPRRSARLLGNTPVFCIHGLEDRLLPFEATLLVYDLLPGRKQLWLIPEVSHPQDAALAVDGEYVAQLAHFFFTALQGPADVPLSSLTWELLLPGAQSPVLRLHNTGPPGAVGITVRTGHTLVYYTVWVEAVLEMPLPASAEPVQVYGLRLWETDGHGTGVQARYTPRGKRYRCTFHPLVMALSQSLHERRVHELEALLHRLPDERPEAPFDFFLGLYCVQIMQRTRRSMPPIAQAAARLFLRYWHYGASQTPSGVATLWGLAAEILGQPATAQSPDSAGP